MRDKLLNVNIKYNCKIKGKGLIGYYIEMSSMITDAKWAGYTDSECLSWVADKEDNLGILLNRENVVDIELEKIGDEYKLPADKEDTNVFNIDIAFIKNILVLLKKPNIVLEQPQDEIIDLAINESKSMESALKEKQKKVKYKQDEYSEWHRLKIEDNGLPIYTSDLKTETLVTYLNNIIEKHNFDFSCVTIEKETNLEIGQYLVYCDEKQTEKTSIEIHYNKRHRLYVFTVNLLKDRNAPISDTNGMTLVGWLKEGKLLNAAFLPCYGTKYKDILSMSHLKNKKYAQLRAESLIETYDKMNCYEFVHTVLFGDKGTHYGNMRYYFDTKTLDFVMRMNTYAGFYKFGFTIE